MKFTLSWLKDHLDTDASLEAICERLTMIGLEVESVDDKAAFKPFTIAKVLTASRAIRMPTSCKYSPSMMVPASRSRLFAVRQMHGPDWSACLAIRATLCRAWM